MTITYALMEKVSLLVPFEFPAELTLRSSKTLPRASRTA